MLNIHVQICTYIENFISPLNIYMHRKCEVPGSKRFHLLPGTVKVVPAKTFGGRVTHCYAVMHELWRF